MPETRNERVTELRAVEADQPPAPALRVRTSALPATLCRSCWTFHRPVESCGPSGLDAA